MGKDLLSRALCVAVGIPLLLTNPGCGGEVEQEDSESVGQEEVLSASTDPAKVIEFVNSQPVVKADDLVSTADIGKTFTVAKDSRPFSSSYWPMTQNGILARWAGSGSLSPAEKYGTLFLTASERQKMYDWIQRNQGRSAPGVQSWFGICQGWSASAVMEKAPLRAITVRKVVQNGVVSVQRCTGSSSSGCVTVYPGDITALLAAAYSNPKHRLIGERCDTNPSAFRFDAAGRVTQAKCRSNAATMFLIATNFIKKAGRAFVINATNNAEVWNQPTYAYRISTYRKISAREAANLVDSGRTTYTWNTKAVDFRQVVMSLTWTKEAKPTVSTAPPVVSTTQSYSFVIELDAQGNVLGGEWTGSSKTRHPAFYWSPMEPGSDVPNLNYKLVKALLDESRR